MSAALAGIAVIGLLAGCSSQGSTTTASKNPTTSSPAGPGDLNQPLWNPCNSVSDDALKAAGTDPTTKHVAVDSGQAVSAFSKSCFWQSTQGPYAVGINSMRATADQIRANSNLVGFRDVQIGSRTGLIHQQKADMATDKLACYVALPFAQGSIVVDVDWSYSDRATAAQLPPCDLAIAHARELEPNLPK
ncbi:DUF3558 domain-containing protein [Nocardia sp. NEAU-G5]|uniref:DUF3558 domain-containing protein n=1 Tax=Nocardia albiluteola TaxID=2842303 RepID=A0ABS6B2H7_9NOCA|nr:DUF3558 domain-containing protein [Nocardia albiluteola]MBU3064449.1 DUF3558 domain-containing protein [Nocardia albiluteola]